MIIYDNGKYREPTAAEKKAWAKIPAPEGHDAVYETLFGEEIITVSEAEKLKKQIDEKISEKDWKGG